MWREILQDQNDNNMNNNYDDDNNPNYSLDESNNNNNENESSPSPPIAIDLGLLKQSIEKLPRFCRATLQELTKFLNVVALHSEFNKMNVSI